MEARKAVLLLGVMIFAALLITSEVVEAEKTPENQNEDIIGSKALGGCPVGKHCCVRNRFQTRCPICCPNLSTTEKEEPQN